MYYDGMSPSGKAVGSGPTIRGFESLRSSQNQKKTPKGSYFDSNLGGQDENRRFDRTTKRTNIGSLLTII